MKIKIINLTFVALAVGAKELHEEMELHRDNLYSIAGEGIFGTLRCGFPISSGFLRQHLDSFHCNVSNHILRLLYIYMFMQS